MMRISHEADAQRGPVRVGESEVPEVPDAALPSKSFPRRVLGRLGSELDSAWAFTMGAVKPYPNDMTMRIFALRRSGHHAMVNWIRYHLPGRHCFLNDCRPGVNPFSGAQFTGSRIAGLFGPHKLFRRRQELKRRFSYKGTLLYNFEEYDLRELPGAMSLDHEELWIGRSRCRADVLMLRDPFNLLASKLRWAYGSHERPSKPDVDDLWTSRELWKVHAREFLGETSYLSDRVTLSYNEWFSSRAYRDSVAEALSFVNRDLGISEVARWGPSVTGDSFDGLSYDGRAQEMKVLERWKGFRDDRVYLDLLADRELHDLSARIFGVLPGTESLRP